MRIRIIGASGTYPVAGRPASGFLIEQGATRVWCDAGPGTFVALPVDTDLIDAIVISHQHPDHCLDLLTAFHAFCYTPNPRRGVPVIGPQSVIDRVSEFVEEGQARALLSTFDFRPVGDGDTTEVGELRVSFAITDHSVPTLASRWESDGRVMAYSADTGPEGDWMRIAEGADLFICEAAYQGESEGRGNHLTAGAAGAIARKAGVHSLMLTHIPPYLDPTRSVAEAEQVFDRPVELAVPGGGRKV